MQKKLSTGQFLMKNRFTTKPATRRLHLKTGCSSTSRNVLTVKYIEAIQRPF